MGRLNEIMAEHVIATSIKQPARLASYWTAMLALDAAGPFSVPQIAERVGIARNSVGHLTDYVAKLTRGNYLSEAGRKGPQKFYRVNKAQTAAPQVQHDGTAYEIESKLTVVIPRSEDGAWGVMKRLGKGGREFTAEAVHEAMQGGLTLEAIADYLRRLAKGGFAEMAGVTMLNGRATKAWKLLRLPAETPRLGLDGRPLKHAAQQDAMWKVIEMSSFFSALDLAQHASADGIEVSAAQAADYAEHLVVSGHLIKREQEGRATIYKMLRHTGPMAPRILKASFVWDPNRNCIFGPGQQVREVRR